MTAQLRRLFERYHAHHEMDRPLLQWIGVVGLVAFPVLYLLRRASGVPGYDDLSLRLVAAALCLFLALRRWWPAAALRWYIGYSYLVVFYCLSFLLSYSMLKNQGGTPFVVNMVIGAVLLILLADWRNTIAMLLGGYFLAVTVLWLTEPAPRIPREFIFAAAGSLLLVVGGALSHQGQKRVEVNRLRLLYAGLAGSIAHEMRNPLAQARHALDTIAASLTPSSPSHGTQLAPAQLASILATVQEGRDAVSRGLQAIELTLQGLQPGSLEPVRAQTLDAVCCVRRAVETFAYHDRAERERVQVDAQGDFRFRGDPTALELVLFNLLRNALYYLPLHPEMRVRITVTPHPSPRIVVRDTGPGIPADMLARLFQEFQTMGKADGTGLGLSFCRRVMRDIGGEIECRSEQGAFTEFILTFPLADPDLAAHAADQQPEAPAARPVHGPLRGRTVLVVDDQALNRTIARALAGQLGMRVVEASHGQEALDLLAGGMRPDAILMDVNMPGMDGLATTRALRGMVGDAAAIPVVAVTANDSAPLRQAAAEAGMQGVIGKPIDQALLAAILGGVLAGSAPAETEPADGQLLNTRRLDDFRRLGMLHDLVPDSLRELRRLTLRLRDCVGAGDLEGAGTALHTLLGLSGEAGAKALHATARGRYEALLEHHSPAGTEWVEELRELLARTEQALRSDYGVVADAERPQTSSHSLRV